MPETTARGLRYPLGVESPDWPGDFDRLADDIDAIVPRVAGGWKSITPSGNVTSASISFPSGLFTEAPALLAQGRSAAAGNSYKSVRVGGVTTTGADLHLHRTNNATTGIDWVALQPGGGASHHGWQRPKYDGTDNTTARPSRYLNSLQTAIRAGMVRVDAGYIETTPTANQPTSAYAEFKPGLFTGQPFILTTIVSEQAGNTVLSSSYAPDGTKGATIWLQRTNTSLTRINWVAIQPTISERLWTPGGPADLPGIFQEFADNAENAIPRIDTGYQTVTPVANQPTFERAEFQPGLFTQPPIVIVTAHSASTQLSNIGVRNTTATGVDIVMTRSNTTNTGVRWLAVQP